MGETRGPEYGSPCCGYKFAIRLSHTSSSALRFEPRGAGLGVRPRGFTLVELLIVLFIAGLMAAFVVPSFVGSIKGMRLKGDVKHLAAALRFARSEAVCSKGLAIVKLDLDDGTYQLIIKKKEQSRGGSAPEGAAGLFGAEGGAASLGGSSTALGGSLHRSSSLGGGSVLGASEERPKSTGGERPIVQLVKKKTKLNKGIKIASFTYGDEKYEDGVCNVFFFPRGTSTGGQIELEGESGRSFVIEIEPVTGSVKIRTPEDYS